MAAVLGMSLFYGLMLRPNSRIFRCALIDGELLEAANTWDFSHRNRFVHVCTCLYMFVQYTQCTPVLYCIPVK